MDRERVRGGGEKGLVRSQGLQQGQLPLERLCLGLAAAHRHQKQGGSRVLARGVFV